MADQGPRAELVQEFVTKSAIYSDLSKTVADLLQRVLSEHGIRPHSITYRSKSPESLAKKIARPDKNYQTLSEITDLAAIRVTSYFESDVDLIAKAIETEFEVDQENTIDKRQSIDADRFGYQSLHYVVCLSKQRRELAEYKRYGGLKLEVQVRSILQHAWAEIEHDLGYKSEAGIPRILRRRFARVAGLLELADAEFDAIRADIAQYADSVGAQIARNPEQVAIDLTSLISAYSTSSALQSLDKAVARAAGATIDKQAKHVLDRLTEKFHFLDLTTIAELETLAEKHIQNVEAFVTKWLDGKKHASLGLGIGAMYLAYLLVGNTGDQQLVARYLDVFNIGAKERGELAAKIIKICGELS